MLSQSREKCLQGPLDQVVLAEVLRKVSSEAPPPQKEAMGMAVLGPDLQIGLRAWLRVEEHRGADLWILARFPENGSTLAKHQV